MEIQWGNFYFECERTVAVILATLPAIAMLQLPPVVKFLYKGYRRIHSSKIANSLEAKITRALRNEQ